MIEVLQRTAAWLVEQPLSWPLVLLTIVTFGRTLLRHLTFLCGLAIAVRGSRRRDRANILRAYATCVASQLPVGTGGCRSANHEQC